jgi:FixJ family two-component response regulator
MFGHGWFFLAVHQAWHKLIGSNVKTPLISIVDDDEGVRIGMTSLVRSLGYDVQTYGSAEDFLDSEERHASSCLISDIQMPGLGGLGLQRVLAADDCPTPIIFITAFPDANVRQSALQAGAAYFLSKPCDGDTLIRCLESVLGTGGAPQG